MSLHNQFLPLVLMSLLLLRIFTAFPSHHEHLLPIQIISQQLLFDCAHLLTLLLPLLLLHLPLTLFLFLLCLRLIPLLLHSLKLT